MVRTAHTSSPAVKWSGSTKQVLFHSISTRDNLHFDTCAHWRQSQCPGAGMPSIWPYHHCINARPRCTKRTLDPPRSNKTSHTYSSPEQHLNRYRYAAGVARTTVLCESSLPQLSHISQVHSGGEGDLPQDRVERLLWVSKLLVKLCHLHQRRSACAPTRSLRICFQRLQSRQTIRVCILFDAMIVMDRVQLDRYPLDFGYPSRRMPFTKDALQKSFHYKLTLFSVLT